jgi:hypothetical protein
VTNAEVLFTNFLIEHNVPIAVSDHAGSLFRKMFPDSEIAKKYGCARTSISLLKYLITRGYSWVLTSLLPSVAQAYGVFCSFSAIELVVSLARLPIIAEVLVRAHRKIKGVAKFVADQNGSVLPYQWLPMSSSTHCCT